MDETTTKTVREIRKEQDIGVRRLAKGAPVSPRTVYQVEKGETTPAFGTIRKISRFLGVDPMEVTEFRAALEAEGLDALPEEPAEISSTEAIGMYGVLEEGRSRAEPQGRDRQIEELVRLMRVLGREDVDAIYRLLFRDEPPRP